MMEYIVYVEMDGRQVRVGTINGKSSVDACFSYSKEYIAQPSPRAISISLPIQAEPFSPKRTGAFFEGLLPEGFMRKSIAESMHINENDYLLICISFGMNM